MITVIGWMAFVTLMWCFTTSQLLYTIFNKSKDDKILQRAQCQGYCFLIALAIAAYCFK